MMDTLPTPESRLIWEGPVRAEAYARYHSTLKSRCLKRYHFLQFINGASAFVAASVLLLDVSYAGYVAATLFLVASVTALILFLSEYGRQAYIERQLSERYSDLATRWRHLWYLDLDKERALELDIAQQEVSIGRQ